MADGAASAPSLFRLVFSDLLFFFFFFSFSLSSVEGIPDIDVRFLLIVQGRLPYHLSVLGVPTEERLITE